MKKALISLLLLTAICTHIHGALTKEEIIKLYAAPAREMYVVEVFGEQRTVTPDEYFDLVDKHGKFNVKLIKIQPMGEIRAK